MLTPIRRPIGTALILAIGLLTSAAAEAAVKDSITWTIQQCATFAQGAPVCGQGRGELLAVSIDRGVAGDSADAATITYAAIERKAQNRTMDAPAGLVGATVVAANLAGLAEDVAAFVKSDAASLFVGTAELDACRTAAEQPCAALARLLPFLPGTWKVKAEAAPRPSTWTAEYHEPGGGVLTGDLTASGKDYGLTMKGTRRTTNTELIPNVAITEELRFELQFKRQWTAIAAAP